MIGLSLYEGWQLIDLMWLYIVQSAFIGVGTLWRLQKIDNYSTHNTDVKTKLGAAFGFLFAYAFGHSIVVIMLVFSNSTSTYMHLLPLVIGLIMLALDQVFYYKRIVQLEQEAVVELGFVIGIPMGRVFFMYLILITGITFHPSPLGVVIFILLKAISDALFEFFDMKTISKLSKPVTKNG